MSKRMRKALSTGNNYEERLKEYFGFHLEGLDIYHDGGEVQVQVVYKDYKHIDTVRRELAQMMPEVEFTKIKRDFTQSAMLWALEQIMNDPCRHPEPKLFMERDNGDLTRTSLSEIARTELRQLELDEEDDIHYRDSEKVIPADSDLRANATD